MVPGLGSLCESDVESPADWRWKQEADNRNII